MSFFVFFLTREDKRGKEGSDISKTLVCCFMTKISPISVSARQYFDLFKSSHFYSKHNYIKNQNRYKYAKEADFWTSRTNNFWKNLAIDEKRKILNMQIAISIARYATDIVSYKHLYSMRNITIHISTRLWCIRLCHIIRQYQDLTIWHKILDKTVARIYSSFSIYVR